MNTCERLVYILVFVHLKYLINSLIWRSPTPGLRTSTGPWVVWYHRKMKELASFYYLKLYGVLFRKITRIPFFLHLSMNAHVLLYLENNLIFMLEFFVFFTTMSIKQCAQKVFSF